MHKFVLIFLFYLLDISSGVNLSKYLNKTESFIAEFKHNLNIISCSL